MNVLESLKEWEAYINGETYGYVISSYDGETDESPRLNTEAGWGYFSVEDAEEAAIESLRGISQG